MLQFRITERVCKLFNFTDDMLSEPETGDGFLGNWYADIVVLDNSPSLLFMSEKTHLSFVLLDVREDHAELIPNAFINGLEHLLQEEHLAERSIHRVFGGIDVMAIATASAAPDTLAVLERLGNLYASTVLEEGGLEKCNILVVMKSINRSVIPPLELSPIKSTKQLLRNSDPELH